MKYEYEVTEIEKEIPWRVRVTKALDIFQRSTMLFIIYNNQNKANTIILEPRY
jgi:hypothetical protein